jgi:hypothetical protein
MFVILHDFLPSYKIIIINKDCECEKVGCLISDFKIYNYNLIHLSATKFLKSFSNGSFQIYDSLS